MDLRSPMGRLYLAVAGLAGLLATGTVAYRLVVPEFSTFDAFYMTLITISTVGFTEVRPLGIAGRVVTSGLILAGVILMTFTAGAAVEVIVEGRLGRYFGRRRLDKRIKSLQGHWIICGFGRMGEHVAHELSHAKRRPPFLIVESSPERTQRCEQLGYLYVLGDASRDEVLEQAGIDRAAGLVSVVATDAENVFICLTAREMRADLRIIARAADEGSESKLRRAGANQVIAPYHVGGLRLSHAILRPAVQDFLDFTLGRDLEIELEEVRLGADSALVGLQLKDSPIRTEMDLILLAVRRASGEMIFNPRSSTQLQQGDTLIAVGQTRNLADLARRAEAR